MSDLQARTSGIVGYNPQIFATSQAKLAAVEEFARKTHDWPLLAEAVDRKLDDQQEFVEWWANSVRSNGKHAVAGERQLSTDDAEARTGISKQQVSKWRKNLSHREEYRDGIVLSATRRAGLLEREEADSPTGESEWFTPSLYIGAAIAVMGGIDVDPASHHVAQRTIGATRFHTRQDDGRAHEWHGRVWLAPPSGQTDTHAFVEKLADEFGGGRTTEAIMLTSAETHTSWFDKAQQAASLVCFHRGRISFLDVDGSEHRAKTGSAFFYFGTEHLELFTQEFMKFGFVR